MKMNPLETLKTLTMVVADSGDIEAIRSFEPYDATTNPSLILKAAVLPTYENLFTDALQYARAQGGCHETQIINAGDKLAVNIGCEILKIVPGRISTEVDARLSYDREMCIAKARKLIHLYQLAGVDKSRVLIKLAATWEGIKAAEELEKEGINCNLTLLFSFAQAQACAEAGVFLISPFVGRITDWYCSKNHSSTYDVENDEGVKSVKAIYQYYKSHHYSTIVMGASFRRIEQIQALAGCDRLTIAPSLLEELRNSNLSITRQLYPNSHQNEQVKPLTEAKFRWQHNQDTMAVEKLAEGIRNFAIDQVKLEDKLSALL